MKYLLSLILLTLSGCALMPSGYGKIEESVSNSIAASAERTICRDIPVGTWMRLYGTNTERLRGWQALCSSPAVTPIETAQPVPAAK